MDDESPAGRLDVFTATFRRDQDYFNALCSSSEFALVAKAITLSKWAHVHFEVLQTALLGKIEERFPASVKDRVEIWTLALTGQIVRDVRLVPYLVIRGLASEAGLPVRRALESIGVLSHFWRDPGKADSLGSVKSKAYRYAFLCECDQKEQAKLKARGVDKRFACFEDQWLEKASQLYNILSTYNVHGGAPEGLLLSELVPTEYSCGFFNRPSPETLGKEKMVFHLVAGLEIVLIELCSIVHMYGKREAVVREAALLFVSLLGNPDSSDPDLSPEIRAVMDDLS